MQRSALIKHLNATSLMPVFFLFGLASRLDAWSAMSAGTGAGEAIKQNASVKKPMACIVWQKQTHIEICFEWGIVAAWRLRIRID